MGTEGFDPVQQQGRCAQEWDSVAEGWRSGGRRSNTVQCIGNTLLEMAGVGRAQVLDIATGTSRAVTAARSSALGPRGSQVPGDALPWPGAGRGAPLRNINFIEMSADAMDLPENGF